MSRGPGRTTRRARAGGARREEAARARCPARRAARAPPAAPPRGLARTHARTLARPRLPSRVPPAAAGTRGDPARPALAGSSLGLERGAPQPAPRLVLKP